MIQNLRPLTQEQRQGAYQSAREAVLHVIGPKPAREHFAGETISKYPVSVTRLITFLCLILLAAAFTPSAIRLYVIGSQTFGQAVPNETAKSVVGLATVLSAEVGQVVFSLALATLGTSIVSRRLLYASMLLSTGIALTGNVQLSLIGHAQSLFGWLEAIAPPLVVLSTAYVLKEQMLEAIEHRHTTERTYQTALNEWHQTTAHPEKHAQWSQLYANALRDTLSRANNRRQETLTALTIADWRALVYRELQSERWFTNQEGDTTVSQPVEEIETIPLALRAKRNGNGVHAIAGAV